MSSDAVLKHGALFGRDDVACTLLHDVLTSCYGSDWLSGWEEPETVWQTVGIDYRLGEDGISRVCKDKIMLMRVLANQDAAWEQMTVFAAAVTACNHSAPNWSVLEGGRAEELSYFMSQTGRLKVQKEPSDEVRRYVSGLLGMDGWVATPPHCDVFTGSLDDYNSRTMLSSRLRALRERIEAGEGQTAKDDDESVIDVAVARMHGVKLYLKKQDERERLHRERYEVAA